MNILLDTHVVIWALTNDPQLTKEAKELISDPGNTVFVSAVSLWEIAMKNQKAPHLCPYHEKIIREYCLRAGYLEMDIRPEHVLEIRALPVKQDRMPANHDPFDRMLIAQAKAERCILLSHDRNFAYYDEDCIRAI